MIWPLATLLIAATLLAAPQDDSFPQVSSKKGLQVELIDDALHLGVRHATLNVDLARLIAPGESLGNASGAAETSRYRIELDGQQFQFRKAAIEELDRKIQALSDGKVLVYLILLVYESGQPDVDRILLHPNYDRNAPNRLSAFNTSTAEGAAWFRATCEFMARRWSGSDRSHGRVVGYILGNEVNSHWWWANCGQVSLEDFVQDYHRTARVAHTAIRRYAQAPRLYLSLEHHWTIRYPAGSESQAFPGRAFLDRFASLARTQGDFDWHLAFHPYPENLFEPRFWQDRSAIDSIDTPRITFKNLPVLTAYLASPELTYAGQPRRIILSEQGFHTPDQPDGEHIQAAAFCYAYRLVEQLDGIDAFILHRHVDHPHEGGLRLGLRAYHPDAPDPRPAKRIYDCFRVADTDGWRDPFAFALPIIGIDAWPTAAQGEGASPSLLRPAAER